MDVSIEGQPRRRALAAGRGWQAGFEKYRAIFQVSLSNNLAYVFEKLVRTIFLAMIIFIFVQLWRVTYSGTGAKLIAGFSLQQMIWYLVLTEAITLARPAINTKIDEEVRTGSLAYSLGRPYNYLLYQYSGSLGEYLLGFGINLMVGAVLALVLVGTISFSISGLLATVPAVLLAISLDLISVMAISLLAFWMEDTRSAVMLFTRFTMILGGLLMPLDVFPEPLASISRALPFGTIFYVPAHLFVAGIEADMLEPLLRQVFWIVVAVLIAVLIYRKGVRRVESNGG